MKNPAAKVLFAVLALAALLLVAASQVAPGIAWWKVLLGAAALAGFFFVAALAYVYVAGSIRALLLCRGAIDTQWLWSPDYPQGFKRYFRRPSAKDGNEDPAVAPNME